MCKRYRHASGFLSEIFTMRMLPAIQLAVNRIVLSGKFVKFAKWLQLHDFCNSQV